MNDFDKARALLHEFKGDAYLFGTGVLPGLGKTVVSAGKRAALISSIFPDSDHFVGTIKDSLDGSGVELVAEISGARPNCPREDLFRITEVLIEVVRESMLRFMKDFTRIPGAPKTALEHHAAIVDAVARHDTRGAEHHMQEHIAFVIEILRKKYEYELDI
jgi:hypothetical protein